MDNAVDKIRADASEDLRSSDTTETSGLPFPAARFVHDPLPERSIRLFRIKTVSPRLEIELRDFQLIDVPLYDAISYCWGTHSLDRRIVCNGASYKVTHHLLDGLCSHFAVFGQRWLWVDAISISQSDDVEKAQQVAQMWKIFGGAERVVVWLGESADNSDLVIDQMEEVTSMQAEGDTVEEKMAKTARSSAFLAIKLEYWDAAYHIFNRGWFARLWVVQEAIVAQELVMLCGKKCIPWSLISKFGWLVSLAAGSQRITNNGEVMSSDDKEAKLYSRLLLVIAIENMRDIRSKYSPIVEDTPAMAVHFAAHAETLEPIDRIYALIGIMHPYFQEQIVVDYSLSSRDHYWKVYARFIRLVNAIGQMHIFWDNRERTRLPDQPTWCYNFNGEPVSTWIQAGMMNSIGAGCVPDSGPWYAVSNDHQVNLTETPERILVEHALVLDSVITVYDLQEGPSDTPSDTWRISSLLNILEQISTAAQQHPRWSNRSDEFDVAFARTIIAGQEQQIDDDSTHSHNQIDDVAATFKDGMVYLRNLPNTNPTLANEYHVHPSYMKTMYMMIKGRKFFITKEGYLGLGPLDTKPGDVVCIVPKAQLPQLFRPTEQLWEDDKLWKVVGNSYVNGIVSPSFTLRPVPITPTHVYLTLVTITCPCVSCYQ